MEIKMYSSEKIKTNVAIIHNEMHSIAILSAVVFTGFLTLSLA
jgi:hypothetical protein